MTGKSGVKRKDVPGRGWGSALKERQVSREYTGVQADRSWVGRCIGEPTKG